MRKSHGNKTNQNQTENNKTDLIHLSVNVAGMDEESDGKNIWKDEKTTISNRELKSMVEFYKKDLVPKYDIPEL